MTVDDISSRSFYNVQKLSVVVNKSFNNDKAVLDIKLDAKNVSVLTYSFIIQFKFSSNLIASNRIHVLFDKVILDQNSLLVSDCENFLFPLINVHKNSHVKVEGVKYDLYSLYNSPQNSPLLKFDERLIENPIKSINANF